MGYLRLVVIAVRQGTPRPAGGTVVGNFVQPPATISTGLDHLYACSRLRLGGGPQEDLGGGVLVNIGYVLPRLSLDQQPPDRDHRRILLTEGRMTSGATSASSGSLGGSEPRSATHSLQPYGSQTIS